MDVPGADMALRIQKGDRNAFSDFFREMHPSCVRLAHSFVNDRDSAMDVVQDAFFKFWQKRDAIDPSRSINALIMTMVRRLSLNWLRDRGLPAEPYEEQMSIAEAQVAVSQNGAAELNAAVERWMKELPPRQREAFEMSRFEGLSHAEIAEIMEVSSRTVNNHIVAALKYLRQKHKEYMSSRDR